MRGKVTGAFKLAVTFGQELTINRLSAGDVAPDFTLPDHEGVQYRLSEVCRTQAMLLVFNLGFV